MTSFSLSFLSLFRSYNKPPGFILGFTYEHNLHNIKSHMGQLVEQK